LRSGLENAMATSTPSITSLGVGSGLDLNSIVTKLVAVERQPLSKMQSEANVLQTKVSSFGQINSLFNTLKDASTALTDPPLWSKSLATSSDPAAVSVSAASTAAAGSYAVTVQSLASSQTLASVKIYTAATDLVGSGTLNIDVGTWASGQSAFTAKANSTTVAIAITAADTLETVRDKINTAGAGVSAALVTDATGVRLSLRSADTGASNGFRISTIDGDGNNTDATGLSGLAWDPTAGTTGMQSVQAAADAMATVNGIAVTSASNSITGAVDGLTILLQKVTTTPVGVSVASDQDSVSKAIKTFADAYNALAKYIGDQTKYDATAKQGGPLQGDSAATGLQSRLRNLLGTTSGASSTFTRLSDIGLQVQRDGTLSVNQTKLDAATGHLAELKKSFAAADFSNPGNDGFARRFSNLATQVLGVDGSVTTRTAGLQKLITTNGDAQTALNERVDTFQRRLIAQYTSLDSTLSKLNSLSSYVTQQLALMNKTTTN
jgi:flagellar hook-associated protein 2